MHAATPGPLARRSTPPANPQILKAIAHPVRLRLYEALVARGPATNARLAQHIPAAPGSLSYHLRQLAAHGFIEEAPELANDGRERWWRAVPGGLHWSEEELDHTPGAQGAAAAAQSVLLGRQIERMRMWVNSGERWGRDWRSAAVNTDTVLRLGPEELREMAAELEEVLDRWRHRSRTVTEKEPSGVNRATVFLAVHAFPFEAFDRPLAAAPTDEE